MKTGGLPAPFTPLSSVWSGLVPGWKVNLKLFITFFHFVFLFSALLGSMNLTHKSQMIRRKIKAYNFMSILPAREFRENK